MKQTWLPAEGSNAQWTPKTGRRQHAREHSPAIHRSAGNAERAAHSSDDVANVDAEKAQSIVPDATVLANRRRRRREFRV